MWASGSLPLVGVAVRPLCAITLAVALVIRPAVHTCGVLQHGAGGDGTFC